ncbi:hypothetical protein KFL_006890090 [Klebsormidium nitens]|uniref:Uncharacterized protein n=1 Tax=Klebsormidium nitens TaxID=105231 RepID=A0A1Y1IJ42_KLENI|nr:hypothetical protein KFL_006890090 [Klebsormidium nitens]|eukprot:GAQ90824.1 hypothetical protein KFL_006890090 [Klebsormidium nitens]
MPSTRPSGWAPDNASAALEPGPSAGPSAPVGASPASAQRGQQDGQAASTRPGEMRHIPGKAEYRRWDFLKGAGPSAPPRVLVHHAKDVGKFKAGWHTKKAVNVIKPDKKRVEQEAQKSRRSEAAHAQRSARLSEISNHLGFNPITGEMRDTRPVRPREEGIKCFQRPQTPPAVVHARHVAAETKFQARADLIRREGLAPRPVTVADNFKPEHYL